VVGTDFFPAGADFFGTDFFFGAGDAVLADGTALFGATDFFSLGAAAFFAAVTSTSFRVRPRARSRPLGSGRVGTIPDI
jgi:hypothetical protein